jgi:hypothetical protein
MKADNRKSSTYKKYNKNIIEILIKGIILLVLFFLVVYIVLEIFSLYLSPGYFTILFFFFLMILAIYNRYVSRWLDKNWHKNYLTWGRGAGAELESQKSLLELGSDYKIISDFQSGKGNIDYICVGPTGIFIIETKSHKGVISWEDGLLRNHKPLEKDFIRQVHGQIYYLRELLKEKIGEVYFIQGIIEFTNANVKIRGKRKGVYIGGRGFPKWVIKNRCTKSLSPSEIQTIFDCLQVEFFR